MGWKIEGGKYYNDGVEISKEEFDKLFEESMEAWEKKQEEKEAAYNALSDEEKKRKEEEYKQLLRDNPMLARWAADDLDLNDDVDFYPPIHD